MPCSLTVEALPEMMVRPSRVPVVGARARQQHRTCPRQVLRSAACGGTFRQALTRTPLETWIKWSPRLILSGNAFVRRPTAALCNFSPSPLRHVA